MSDSLMEFLSLIGFRAHLNDLENIPAFLFISYLYIQTDPDSTLCHVLIWAFTMARFAHTLVYAYYPVPQPARAIAFFVGLLISLYMTIAVFFHFVWNVRLHTLTHTNTNRALWFASECLQLPATATLHHYLICCFSAGCLMLSEVKNKQIVAL